MNLGMLLSWEQVYLMKVKNKAFFENEFELINYLKKEKGLDEYQIQSGFDFLNFANEHFTKKEWDKVEDLFTILEEGRIKGDLESIFNSIGEVLWEMGNLFGTNLTDRYH
jgi:hypothetical protein